MMPDISWTTLLKLAEPHHLCSSCETRLNKLRGERCEKCSRLSDGALCADCQWRQQQTEKTDPLLWNYSVWAYNDMMQAMIARWKYRGDYCLGWAFQKDFRQGLGDIRSFLPKRSVVVPIPLSEKRWQERGFNQAAMLARFLPLPTHDILVRQHQEKQAQKTRRQRLESDNPFQLRERMTEPVLLVDDIYTTGTTLRHAAAILKDEGCPAVYAYTLIRG